MFCCLGEDCESIVWQRVPKVRGCTYIPLSAIAQLPANVPYLLAWLVLLMMTLMLC